MSKYKEALEEVQKELAGLVAQRAELDKRIAKLRNVAVGLAALENGDIKSPLPGMFDAQPGLTDGCRAVLKGSDVALIPTEIKDALVRMGFDLSSYNNVMASIHTTLKRLVENGEAEVEKIWGGKKAYKTKAKL